MRLMFIFVIAGICSASVAQAGNRETTTPDIGVITFPIGTGIDARAAQSLIPTAQNTVYRIVPLESFEGVEPLEDTKALLAKTEQIESEAQERALAFDLVGSARLLREGADGLLTRELLLLDPSLVATWHMNAAAASADAGEQDLALKYFQMALAINSDLRPDGTISPKAADLFETASKRGSQQISLPQGSVMSELCITLGLDGLLIVSTNTNDGQMTVREHLHLQSGGRPEPETHHRISTEEPDHSRWLTNEQSRLHHLLVAGLTSEEEKRPWYKKWWVYTSVGGVIAAGVLTSILIVNANKTPNVEVTVFH